MENAINLKFSLTKESAEHFASTIDKARQDEVLLKIKQIYSDAYNSDKPELLTSASARISEKSELDADFNTKGFHIDRNDEGEWEHKLIIEFIGTSS